MALLGIQLWGLTGLQGTWVGVCSSGGAPLIEVALLWLSSSPSKITNHKWGWTWGVALPIERELVICRLFQPIF